MTRRKNRMSRAAVLVLMSALWPLSASAETPKDPLKDPLW